jgi:hypothetical protein
VEMVEEARQETVRIIKSSSKSTDDSWAGSIAQLKEKHWPHHPTGRQRQCNCDSQQYGLQTEDHIPSWGSIL